MTVRSTNHPVAAGRGEIRRTMAQQCEPAMMRQGNGLGFQLHAVITTRGEGYKLTAAETL